MAEALNLNTQTELESEITDESVLRYIDALKKSALKHYDLSLDRKTRNEQTVVHRGMAKKQASLLCHYPEQRVTALNLLARIALDEGFYSLAQYYLKDALKLDADDAGCWYSLGHTYLALKDASNALDCFTRSIDISPSETRSMVAIAYTLAQMGRVVDAFQMYRQLIKIHPNDRPVQEKLFEVVSNIRADYYQPDLEKEVTDWLDIGEVNHQALAPLAMSLLKHKYRIDDDDAVIDIQDLANDPLLLKALGKMYFTDNSIEQFTRQLRKQVLMNCVAVEYRDKPLLNLAGQLAVHAEHNEHIYLYDDDEKSIVDALRKLISESVARTPKLARDIAHLITLYSMYEPIAPLLKTCTTHSLSELLMPDYARDVFHYAVVEYRNEMKIARHIRELGEIHNPTSIKVKQQYEENPYPRWLHLNYNTPTNYGRALENELQGFRAPEFFNMGTIKVLIAGAGTGKHALHVARYFRNVEVLAIDLSKQALAYAQRQATRYGIRNIRFLCADILQLQALDEKFHVIECSGVLHHMKSPEDGLKTLKTLLKPQGLIKLGLYSYQARTVVRQIRRMIAEFDLPCNLSGIRTVRQSILEGKMPYDFSGILSSPDFYSSSGCRDLLFHVQESQYEPKELQQWMATEDLNFLGFILSSATRAGYRNLYPEDTRMTNLDNWQIYEQQHPAAFATMFQFYVQTKEADKTGLNP
ncbi:MAG: methyltransferase domain-containing protein [Reinekea sp.]